jgi:hypothetical protein
VGAAAALLVISVAVGLAVARGGPASHGTVVIPLLGDRERVLGRRE